MHCRGGICYNVILVREKDRGHLRHLIIDGEMMEKLRLGFGLGGLSYSGGTMWLHLQSHLQRLSFYLTTPLTSTAHSSPSPTPSSLSLALSAFLTLTLTALALIALIISINYILHLTLAPSMANPHDEKFIPDGKGAQADFKGNVKVDDRPPSKEVLEKVAEYPLLDKEGKKCAFGGLWKDDAEGSRRVLVVFVRHFFCGVSSLLFSFDAP